jgi:hypothetical protein
VATHVDNLLWRFVFQKNSSAVRAAFHEVGQNCVRHWDVSFWAIMPGTGGVTMKRALMAASVLAVFASTQALAQTVGVGPAGTVIVEPEQPTVIKEYGCEGASGTREGQRADCGRGDIAG